MAAWEFSIFKTLTTCIKILEKLRDCNFHPGGRSFGRRPMLRAAHVFIADSSLPLQFTVWFLKIQQKSTFSNKQQNNLLSIKPTNQCKWALGRVKWCQMITLETQQKLPTNHPPAMIWRCLISARPSKGPLWTILGCQSPQPKKNM